MVEQVQSSQGFGRSGANGPLTVLVVDDQPSICELTRRTLATEGYAVVTASSGQEALAAFARAPPDGVLLDIRLPDVDGFEVLSRLRALPGGQDVPVLVVTGLRDLDTFDRSVRAGAADYLTKPFKPSDLLLRVQSAIELRRLSAERDALYQIQRQERDHLQRALLENERLSAFLVHDLKGPVTGVRLATQMLLSDPDSSPRTRDIANRIAHGADTMMRMITDLLDIAKGDEGRLVLSPSCFDLAEVVADVFAGVDFQAGSRGVALVASIDVSKLVADRELIRRALENLVENAVRHAPRGSSVTVSAVSDGAGVRVSVRDQGPGIPAEIRDTLFDRFVRAGERSERTGRGLGLAFCRLVVEAHGGRLWVEDAAPGAVFSLWLRGASA